MSEKFEKISSFYKSKDGVWQKKDCTFKIVSSKENSKGTKILAEKNLDMSKYIDSSKPFEFDMGKGFFLEMSFHIEAADQTKHAELFRKETLGGNTSILSPDEPPTDEDRVD